MVLKKKKREWHKFKKCCDCGNDIEIKYNQGKQAGSQKNEIGFGSKKQKDKDKYRCSECGLLIYYKEPKKGAESVDLKVRNMFYGYIRKGWFGEWEEK